MNQPPLHFFLLSLYLIIILFIMFCKTCLSIYMSIKDQFSTSRNATIIDHRPTYATWRKWHDTQTHIVVNEYEQKRHNYRSQTDVRHDTQTHIVVNEYEQKCHKYRSQTDVRHVEEVTRYTDTHTCSCK